MEEKIKSYLEKTYDLYVVKMRTGIYPSENYILKKMLDIVFVFKKDTNNGIITESEYNKNARVLRLECETTEKMISKIDKIFKK